MPIASNPLIYVVIVTLNGRDDTIACLNTLRQQDYPAFEVHLVDNGSTDDTLEVVARDFPEVHLHPQGKNLGFAAGCNVALKLAQAAQAYALLLNNDTDFGPTLLRQLVKRAQTEPTIGLVTPKIYYAQPKNLIWSTGHERHSITFEKTGGEAGQIEQVQTQQGRLNQVIERDYLFGCALLITPSVLEQVGLLDERFFFTYEDLDYSIRTQQAGFRLVCDANALLWHKVSATAGQDSPVQNYHLGYASVLFFAKHAPSRWLPLIVLNRFASGIKRILRLLVSGKPRTALAYGQGVAKGVREAWFYRKKN